MEKFCVLCGDFHDLSQSCDPTPSLIKGDEIFETRIAQLTDELEIAKELIRRLLKGEEGTAVLCIAFLHEPIDKIERKKEIKDA